MEADVGMIGSHNDERAALHTKSNEEPKVDSDRNVARYVQRSASILLLLMALAAVVALGTDVSNYIRSVKSAYGLSLAISDILVIDDDNPRAIVHFKVQNDTLLDIELERYLFELYLDGEWVGSSYSSYLGTDPGVDPTVHREAMHLDQVLAPGQTLDLEFTIYIYTTQMENVRRSLRSGSMSWLMNAEFDTFLSYAREEKVLRLRARFEE